jgi:hypothetical protein
VQDGLGNLDSTSWEVEVQSGAGIGAEPPTSLPQQYTLHEPYPNPFNPTATIGFDVPQAGKVSLRVYDLSGRLVATLLDARLEAGRYQRSFNAANLASGVYIARLTAPDFSANAKLVFTK